MKRHFVDEGKGIATDEKLSKTEATTENPSTVSDLVDGGVHLVKVACLDAEANNPRDGIVPRALSFFELIRAIRPAASIHFNYCIDPQWVLSVIAVARNRQYSPRRLRQCPITFVVGSRQLGPLRAAVPSDCAANVRCAGVPLPFAYGTHHAKLSLFEAEDGQAVHVVIGTANLVAEDWTAKTQAFYHARGTFGGRARTTTDGGSTASTSAASATAAAVVVDGHSSVVAETAKTKASKSASSSAPRQQRFRDDLLAYLRAAYPPSAGEVHRTVQFWVERIGQADFSHITDQIVASVPGRFQHNNNATGGDEDPICRFGHLRLRRLLSEAFNARERQRHKTFVAQSSSVGSLGARPEAWLCDEFLTSLSGGRQMLSASALKLIYPSVENVRHSLEGYAAGLSLPYASQTHQKQTYLKQFLHQWRSDRLKRTAASPHVKSYVALDSVGECQWLLLTSANLSHSAWGKLEKGGTQLFIRSFELGVLLCAKDHPQSLFPPFDIPLTKYSADDEPFLVDKLYPTRPDCHGFRGAMDAQAALT